MNYMPRQKLFHYYVIESKHYQNFSTTAKG